MGGGFSIVFWREENDWKYIEQCLVWVFDKIHKKITNFLILYSILYNEASIIDLYHYGKVYISAGSGMYYDNIKYVAKQYYE